MLIALHCKASAAGQLEVVRYFIDPMTKDDQDRIPLHSSESLCMTSKNEVPYHLQLAEAEYSAVECVLFRFYN